VDLKEYELAMIRYAKSDIGHFSFSLKAVEFAALEWVDWFNNRRLLAPTGYVPPARAEACTYASPDQPAMAA
jgi:hypothetical protein